MVEIIAYPHHDHFITQAYQRGLELSGKSFCIVSNLEGLADTLRKDGLPNMLICQYDHLDAIRRLAWEKEEFSGLKTTPLVVVWGGSPGFIIGKERDVKQPMNTMETFDIMAQSPDKICELVTAYFPTGQGHMSKAASLERSRHALPTRHCE